MSQLKELADMRASYREEKAFLKKLKSDPITESEYESIMVNQGKGNSHKFIKLMEELKAQGLIVPDAPMTFEQFKEDNEGRVAIKDVTMAHMTSAEFRQFRKAFPFAVFREMDGGKVKHFRYVDEKGRTRTTGKGMNVQLTDWTAKRRYTDVEASMINKQIKVFTRERANVKELFEKLRMNNPEVELSLDKVVL